MKLLTVTHFYESHGGGVERVAAQLNRAFVKDGHVAIWAASDRDPPPEAPVNAAPLRCADPLEKLTGLPMPIPGPGAALRLARAVRASDAVIIHDSLYLTSILAAILAAANRKPWLLIQHISGVAFPSRALRLTMRLANILATRAMLRAAHRLVFISDVVRRDLLGDPPWRAYRLLFNGVDATVFHPPALADRVLARASLFGLPTTGALALFVGRFVEKKGLSVLRTLARRRPDLNFALIGSGPIRPESWGLANVRVLGPRSQAEIAELYGAADFLLLPSVGEGYPLVIQEAMACGLPVICGEASARADPGAAQWLRGVNIDLADCEGSATRCSEAIDQLLRDPPDADAMAAYAARAYDWDQMAATIAGDLSAQVEALHHAAGRLEPRRER